MAEECKPTNFFTDLWTVKMSDFQRGLVVAIISVPIEIAYKSVTATPMTLTLNWRDMLGAAIAGGLAYIGKNLLTGNSGKFLRNEK